MAPIPPTKPSSRVSGVKHHELERKRGKSRIVKDDAPKSKDPSTIENKIEFFRFMGLEMKKIRDVDGVADSNNNDNQNNNNNEFCNSQPTASRSFKQTDNKASGNCDIPADKFTLKPSRKCQINKETTSGSRSMIDHQKIIESMRECSVMIIGEKCRICSKSFKCIKDLELHARRKHTRKKPRRKVVLFKIGDEVISRVPIRRKHLKRVYRDDDFMENNSDDGPRGAWNAGDEKKSNENAKIPLIDIDDIRDIADVESNSAKITGCDVLLSPLGTRDAGSLKTHFADDDEDIKEVLRITRSTSVRTAINHETPNRTERELLLSEAIRELERFNKNMIDAMDIIEFDDEEKTMNDKHENYCWQNDGKSQTSHFDIAEDNCFCDVRNNCELDFSLGDGNSLAGVYNEEYFNEDDTCRDYKGYRNENGDFVPYYIDYTQCLDNNHVLLNNHSGAGNGNSGYDLETSFYNEARIGKWNELANAKSTFNYAIR